jgi:hypothetical protein
MLSERGGPCQGCRAQAHAPVKVRHLLSPEAEWRRLAGRDRFSPHAYCDLPLGVHPSGSYLLLRERAAHLR